MIKTYLNCNIHQLLRFHIFSLREGVERLRLGHYMEKASRLQSFIQ